jgi:hypothetical protein
MTNGNIHVLLFISSFFIILLVHQSRSAYQQIAVVYCTSYHYKKRLAMFRPTRMSIAKLSLARNDLIIPGQGDFG